MATTLRATVMLVILVGVPVAWIYLGPLPMEAQQVVNRLITTAKNRLVMVPLAVPGQPRISAPRFDIPVSPGKSFLVGAADTAGIMSDVEPELEQLRSMGVAEYALESWGMRGNLYRFHCIMPIGPSDNLTTQFEAVNEDPRVSVRQVHHEVASWQQDRLDIRRGGPQQRVSPLHGAALPRGR
jgi:hypothetical protein